jgi:hypothetical protein
MKNLTVICSAIVICAGIAANASAAERAVSVPKSTLASMGFASAHQLSDSDGLAVRGKGTSNADYSARFSAIGSSLHFGGNVGGSIHHVNINAIFAGGGAHASAH